MNLILKIIKYEFSNILRSKWLIIYTLFFLAVSYSLFTFGGDSGKALVSLMNVIVIIIPLISIIFGTMYLYNSREFVETILCQPISRKALFIGVYLGTVIPLSLSFAAGVLIPFFLSGNYDEINTFLLLMVTGIFLTIIFTAAAFVIGLKNDDKVKGLGFAIFVWLLLAIVYDGIVLFVIYIFQDYPVENAVLALSILNPVDLGRILFLLNFDISALMGYTGALFQKFFSGNAGILVSSASLCIWSALLILWGLKSFDGKDF